MKVTLSIETGISFYTAIFRRVYSCNVFVSGDNVYLDDIKSKDYAPSGYAEGGKDQYLAERQQMIIPLECTTDAVMMRKYLAIAALRLDKQLTQMTGCKHLNESRDLVLTALGERAAMSFTEVMNLSEVSSN